jgi:hypothetical protein
MPVDSPQTSSGWHMRSRPIATRRYRIPTVGPSLIAFALIMFVVPCYPQPAAGSAKPCPTSGSALGVTINSCTFTLNPSPAGSPNYYVDVTIKYTASPPDQAVRFSCDFSGAGAPISRLGVLRKSDSSMRFVSPFNPPSASIDVACTVVATTAHPS